MTPFFKLTLSASAATLFALTQAAPAYPPPRQVDACSILGGLNATDVTYQYVVNCYNAIPFDSKQAGTTLSTMLTIFKDFYVFTDSALSPTATRPFSVDPVDIIGELEKIGRTMYTSDYKFHTDISNAVTSLRDAHTDYFIDCYRAYSFAQKLSLYAPVVDGKQANSAKRNYDDCTVNTINGLDALTYVKNYARDVTDRSHDPNARLNFLLTTQGFNEEKGVFVDKEGDFSWRVTVPEAAYVDYQIQCPHLTQPVDLREEWLVFPQNDITFEDIDSYVTNVCLPSAETTPPHVENSVQLLFKPYPQIIKRAEPEPEPETVTPGHQYPGAEQFLAGNATVFYHLKDRPDTGVVVCHTSEIGDEERDVVVKGLKALNDCNVTNIIVDLQSNIGGYAGFAAFLADIFFPSSLPLPADLPSDIRVTKAIQQISAQGYNPSTAGFYDAYLYVNLNNGTGTERYQNNDLFEHPVTITRNGRTNLWTEKTLYYFEPVPPNYNAAVSSFTWSDKVSNIRLLTDGLCGSACAISAYCFTRRHNVTPYFIGGIHGEDLSMFSFAGAAMIGLSAVQSWYKQSNMTSPMADLPYRSVVSYSWLEMYGEGRTLPLEYDAELYSPTYRLDYTPTNARSRKALWNEVAAASWNQGV
ncbi:hypothetical protein BGZ96_002073 [Linnemannia gamsii]|uniref:Tail specific protease domain-containing protein n=1 Tax=Linnemannia gamsii TaxID=64522 RepID=A0ABQ7JL50_9FUNG|nr:hypothetical protein BGZ96_002073 [Linnemannia gamsii]